MNFMASFLDIYTIEEAMFYLAACLTILWFCLAGTISFSKKTDFSHHGHAVPKRQLNS